MRAIFDFYSAQEYLQEVWQEKQKRNKRFSIRSWTKQLGISSHAPLYETITGKRKIPLRLIPALITNLKLNPLESQYFELLAQLDRAQTKTEKDFYEARMKKVRLRTESEMAKIDGVTEYIKDPLHLIILELTQLKGFIPEAKWIKEHLEFPTSVEHIQSVIDRLLSLNLLQIDDDGKMSKVHQYLSSKSDIKDIAIQECHRNILTMASDAVKKQNVLEREFQALMINIKKDRMAHAKEMIRNFMGGFMDYMTTPDEDGDSTYCISLQFFEVGHGEKK